MLNFSSCQQRNLEDVAGAHILIIAIFHLLVPLGKIPKGDFLLKTLAQPAAF